MNQNFYNMANTNQGMSFQPGMSDEQLNKLLDQALPLIPDQPNMPQNLAESGSMASNNGQFGDFDFETPIQTFDGSFGLGMSFPNLATEQLATYQPTMPQIFPNSGSMVGQFLPGQQHGQQWSVTAESLLAQHLQAPSVAPAYQNTPSPPMSTPSPVRYTWEFRGDLWACDSFGDFLVQDSYPNGKRARAFGCYRYNGFGTRYENGVVYTDTVDRRPVLDRDGNQVLAPAALATPQPPTRAQDGSRFVMRTSHGSSPRFDPPSSRSQSRSTTSSPTKSPTNMVGKVRTSGRGKKGEVGVTMPARASKSRDPYKRAVIESGRFMTFTLETAGNKQISLSQGKAGAKKAGGIEVNNGDAKKHQGAEDDYEPFHRFQV